MNIKPSFLIVIWLMSAASHLPAQTFKGYHIGETTTEFLATESSIQKKLDDCRTNVPRELTPDEIRQQYGKKALQDFLRASQSQANATSHIAVMSRDPDLYGEDCASVIDALVHGAGAINGVGFARNSFSSKLDQRIMALPILSAQRTALEIGRTANARNTYDIRGRDFVFAQGLLASFSVGIGDSVITLRDDITTRVGVAPTSFSIPMHNGFGATWDDFTFMWDTDQVHVRLTQQNNPAATTPANLYVESRSLYLEEEARRKAAPSPLD
jgi:hypothetical protein